MKVKNAYYVEKIIEKTRIHGLNVLIWYVLRMYLNKRLPHYYKKSKIVLGSNSNNYVNKEVIVSLTSFPDRMDKIYITLESLFRQTVHPDRFILWLADEQFPDKKSIESKLKKYIRQGLEVCYCDDLRSHKKYFYTMKENPEAIVITVDDDIIYPENMIEKLLISSLQNPNKIICHRAHLMNSYKHQLLPYNSWIYRAMGYAGANIMYFPTGCGGVLYPPNSLSNHVFDKNILKEKCFWADDVWLKCMSFLKGTEVVLTEKNNPEVIDVVGTNKSGLAQINVKQNLNDKQMKAVSDYYNIKWIR